MSSIFVFLSSAVARRVFFLLTTTFNVPEMGMGPNTEEREPQTRRAFVSIQLAVGDWFLEFACNSELKLASTDRN